MPLAMRQYMYPSFSNALRLYFSTISAGMRRRDRHMNSGRSSGVMRLKFFTSNVTNLAPVGKAALPNLAILVPLDEVAVFQDLPSLLVDDGAHEAVEGGCIELGLGLHNGEGLADHGIAVGGHFGRTD